MESKIDQIKNKMVIQSCSANLESVSTTNSEELKNYGLSDFVQAVLKEVVVNETFVAELIASYDPKTHTAKISGRDLYVTQDALSAALILPDTNVDADEDEEDASPVDFSDEVRNFACFLYNFVMRYMYLNPEKEIVAKVHEMSRCIMRGHPKKFDFSGFMWVLIENEILKGTDIKDCYYGQHMQCLIRDQLSDLFVVAPDNHHNPAAESAPVESEISGQNQFKKVYQRRRKGGTASGSSSRAHDVNSGSPSSASSTSRGHDVNPGSPCSSTSKSF